MNVAPTVEELQNLIRNEEDFEKYLKKRAFDEELGKNEWLPDGKKGFRFTLPDGSYIKIKAYDTIKKIYNSKNVEVPGRESFLSYLDVVVAPAGQKMYMFTAEMKQVVWAYTKGKPPAKDTHAININNLKTKANALGINLESPESWDNSFVRYFQKR